MTETEECWAAVEPFILIAKELYKDGLFDVESVGDLFDWLTPEKFRQLLIVATRLEAILKEDG